MNITNPKTNETIDSPFATTADAIEALGKKERGSFADDIYTRAAGGKGLSQGQLFWLHKLALPEKPQEPAARIDLTGLRRMFAKAAEHLKFPSVLLQRVDGAEVKIYTAGPSAKYPGSLMVVSRTYGDAYYGRVDADGDFYAGRAADEEMIGLLSRMSSHPEETAAEYGRLTGRCAFCSSELTDERSTAVGYGKVCASRFNLSWGGKKVASK